MTKSFGSKQIIPILSCLMGVVFLWTGLSKFGFWVTGTGPTPAFVPTIISVLLILTSIMAFAQSFKDGKPNYCVGNFKVIFSAIGIFAFTFLIGLFPTIAVYIVTWLRLLEKTPWKQTLIVLASIMAILIGVFVLWLRVPFPMGIIYEAIFY